VRALVQVARQVRVARLALVLVAQQVLVQVARLVQVLVLVARLVLARVARLALVLVRALAEHLPQLMLRQLQSRCQLELCRLL